MPQQTIFSADTKLVNLDLWAVALCNTGANSRAHILLNKRKETDNMTFEEVIKGLTEDAAAAINKHIEEITAGHQAELNTLTNKISTLEKSVTPPAEPEDIFKGVSPAAREHIEKMQKQVQLLMEEKLEKAATELFEKCKAIPVEEPVLKNVLKSASPEVVAVLQKASTAIEEALLKSKGTDTTGEKDMTNKSALYAKLENDAKSLMEVNKSLSYEQAFVEACIQDPDTYAKYNGGV